MLYKFNARGQKEFYMSDTHIDNNEFLKQLVYGQFGNDKIDDAFYIDIDPDNVNIILTLLRDENMEIYKNVIVKNKLLYNDLRYLDIVDESYSSPNSTNELFENEYIKCVTNDKCIFYLYNDNLNYFLKNKIQNNCIILNIDSKNINTILAILRDGVKRYFNELINNNILVNDLIYLEILDKEFLTYVEYILYIRNEYVPKLKNYINNNIISKTDDLIIFHCHYILDGLNKFHNYINDNYNDICDLNWKLQYNYKLENMNNIDIMNLYKEIYNVVKHF
jgi:hypothetical protein